MNYKKYTVSQGDTLQVIAQHLTGSMANWKDIATYNKLRYPYISDEGSLPVNGKRVATVGDVLYIPTNTNSPIDIMDRVESNIFQEEVKRYSLGQDINITRDRSAIEERGGSDELVGMSAYNGDLETLSNFDNVTQAILLRLNTPKGTLILHPEYGIEFYDMLGQKNTSSNMRKFEVLITEALMGEPRIKDIEVTHRRVYNRGMEFKISVTPIDLDEQINLITLMDKNGSFVRN